MFARIPFRQSPPVPVPIQSVGRLRPVVPGLVCSPEWADLARIYEPAVNLCVIERAADAEIAGFAAALLGLTLEIDITERIDYARYDFSRLAPALDGLPGCAAWRCDVAHLAGVFCDLFGIERIGLRLRTLDLPMCPRFHTDHVLARLVCTYGGLGTEWLPNDAVDRSKLGARANGLPDATSGVLREGHAIRQIPAYAVGLMKGDAWEGNAQRGLVHRSPKPDAAAPRRLLLTLDLL